MVVAIYDALALSEQNAVCEACSAFMCKMWWLILLGGDLRQQWNM